MVTKFIGNMTSFITGLPIKFTNQKTKPDKIKTFQLPE